MSHNDSGESIEEPSTSRIVGRHQIIVFFALAFVISWAIWFLSPALAAGDHNALLVLTLIGAYGPALSAIFVAGRAMPDRSPVSGVRRWWVFIVVFLLVDLIWLLSTDKFGSFEPRNPVLFTSKLVLSGLGAFVISGIFSGRKGVHDLLLPLTNWRVGLVWYLIVILGVPLAITLAIFLALLLRAPFPAEYYSVQPQPLHQLLPGLLLAYVQTMLFQGPLNEEPGWRGFALPRLQTTRGSILASIVIGVLWGLWHAPLYFTGIYSGGVEAMVGRILWHIPLALLFTWVYNRTHGSLLMSVLLHTSINSQADVTAVIFLALPR
jgi:membrane protease YdiL (CAAX protease family)